MKPRPQSDPWQTVWYGQMTEICRRRRDKILPRRYATTCFPEPIGDFDARGHVHVSYNHQFATLQDAVLAALEHTKSPVDAIRLTAFAIEKKLLDKGSGNE